MLRSSLTELSVQIISSETRSDMGRIRALFPRFHHRERSSMQGDDDGRYSRRWYSSLRIQVKKPLSSCLFLFPKGKQFILGPSQSCYEKLSRNKWWELTWLSLLFNFCHLPTHPPQFTTRMRATSIHAKPSWRRFHAVLLAPATFTLCPVRCCCWWACRELKKVRSDIEGQILVSARLLINAYIIG